MGSTVEQIYWDSDVYRYIYQLVQYYAFNSPDGIYLFAQDEYPSPSYFSARVKDWALYSIKFNSRVVGYVLLSPSNFFRDIIHVYTDIYVLPESETVRGKTKFVDVLVFLLREAKLLVQKSGQHACLYESYIVNTDLCRAVRNLGYNMVVSIPLSGNLNKLGFRDSMVFMKELKNLKECLQERESLPCVAEYYRAGKPYPKDDILKKKIDFKLPYMVDIPEKLKHIGPLLIDKAQKHDIPGILNMYNKELLHGHGLSPFDVPSEDALHAIIDNPGPHYYFVIKTGDEVIGVHSSLPSEYSRSCSAVSVDGITMIKPEYVNRGIGFSCIRGLMDIHSHSKYRAIVTDHFACNPSSYLYYSKIGGHLLGRIPYGGRAGKEGWDDLLINWIPLKQQAKL